MISIKNFEKTADYTSWLKYDLPSGVIVYVAETEKYTFSTNNILGIVEVYTGTNDEIQSGDYPEQIKELIRIHNYNLNHQDPLPLDDKVKELDEKVSSFDEGKQDTLVSGENIKTINGLDILGEGNIEIKGGVEDVYTKDETDALLYDKLDVTAYTEYNDSELRELIANKQDVGDYALNDNVYSREETDTLLYDKQDTLTAGEGIDIIDNVISIKNELTNKIILTATLEDGSTVNYELNGKQI